ncbi:MAG: formylglycine-generating enzyme family protein [Cyanobacteria bacterium J06631_2]
MARKFNNDELIEPKQHNQKISDRINEAILKGMEIEPGDRPQLIENWLELMSSTKENLKVFKFDTVKVNNRGQIIKTERHLAKYFVEDFGNGITIEMIEIPGGTFMMGSPEVEEGRYKNESPQHEVTVSSFYMGKYEVTQAQWKAVAGLPQVMRELKPEPSIFKGDDLPVERVSWYDAVEFCARLSKATGREYKLPSKAQWEYACRAGTTTPFHFGETITTELVNYHEKYTYRNEPKGESIETTTPVGSFPPNAFGLYDMHGNVWERCADTYQEESYEGAPRDGSAWIVEGNNSKYVLRGGYLGFDPQGCCSDYRDGNAPNGDLIFIGFRCIATRTL